MTTAGDPLLRIAAALERLVPPVALPTDWTAFPAYVCDGRSTRPVASIVAPAPDLLRGIDQQKRVVLENVARHAAGAAAHDMLLWGSRGIGKSALLRASVVAAQENAPGAIALVQVAQDALGSLAGLFAAALLALDFVGSIGDIQARKYRFEPCDIGHFFFLERWGLLAASGWVGDTLLSAP